MDRPTSLFTPCTGISTMMETELRNSIRALEPDMSEKEQSN